mmetsp:Transcript_92220/g.269870  ORF Transcript_92220/g.269870 Transcript_92220/m.269870 type:complete len:201 (-) Transcript_92220:657-1259(-)
MGLATRGWTARPIVQLCAAPAMLRRGLVSAYLRMACLHLQLTDTQSHTNPSPVQDDRKPEDLRSEGSEDRIRFKMPRRAGCLPLLWLALLVKLRLIQIWQRSRLLGTSGTGMAAVHCKKTYGIASPACSCPECGCLSRQSGGSRELLRSPWGWPMVWYTIVASPCAGYTKSPRAGGISRSARPCSSRGSSGSSESSSAIG